MVTLHMTILRFVVSDYLNSTNSSPISNRDAANILWEKASESQLESNTAKLVSIALRLRLPVLLCSNVLSSNEFHSKEIDFLCCSLIDTVSDASAVMPHKTKQKNKHVPG